MLTLVAVGSADLTRKLMPFKNGSTIGPGKSGTPIPTKLCQYKGFNKRFKNPK